MTQMTQNPRIVSAHAGQRLGHLIKKHGQLITQMTQLCKIRITTNNLQLGVDNAKNCFTIASLANEKPVNIQLI